MICLNGDKQTKGLRSNIQRSKRREELKYYVFTHYSRAKVPICAWCDVIDLDMLCLDHINDNGKGG